MIFLSLFIEKNIIPCFSVPPFSHLTSCTPTTSNLYLDYSLAAAVSDSALYRLLTLPVPTLMFLSTLFRSHKESVHFLSPCIRLATGPVFRWGIVSISPKIQASGPSLVGYRPLLIQYIRSHPSYWRPYLHPQHEDALCCGARDRLITEDFLP